ncbi:hypothetical protein C8R44DRAFT_736562 [Mycena epipterygia]|nr:hypothetical protein C8R44DRAFT_736562 [Mycena epipterygia]
MDGTWIKSLIIPYILFPFRIAPVWGLGRSRLRPSASFALWSYAPGSVFSGVIFSLPQSRKRLMSAQQAKNTIFWDSVRQYNRVKWLDKDLSPEDTGLGEVGRSFREIQSKPEGITWVKLRNKTRGNGSRKPKTNGCEARLLPPLSVNAERIEGYGSTIRNIRQTRRYAVPWHDFHEHASTERADFAREKDTRGAGDAYSFTRSHFPHPVRAPAALYIIHIPSGKHSPDNLR